MSSTGGQKRTLVSAAKRVWGLGGLRAYYRGLGVRQWLRPTRESLNRHRLAWLAYSRTCHCCPEGLIAITHMHSSDILPLI